MMMPSSGLGSRETKALRVSRSLPANFRSALAKSRALSALFRIHVAALCLLLSLANLALALPERSISVSHQFIVFGGDLQLRGALCDVAERLKTSLLTILDQRDDWKTPILINAGYAETNFPEAPKAALNFSQTGAGLKIQLDLTIGADAHAAEIQREILRAIILEIAYRQQRDVHAGSAYVAPPDWLLDGILALKNDGNSGQISAALKSAAASNQLPLEQILAQKPELLDAPARTLYRDYSFALLDSLSHSAVGRKELGQFIANLPSASNDPLADLQKSFPEWRGAPSDVGKKWAANIQRIFAAHDYELFGAAETETQLAAILRDAKITDNDHPPSTAALRELNQKLLLLETRANPVYRPILAGYQQSVARLARGKSKAAEQKFAELKSLRERLSQRMRAIDDYMNWFEATHSEKPSGAFEDYSRAADAAQQIPKRHDPISLYLDAVETQLQN